MWNLFNSGFASIYSRYMLSYIIGYDTFMTRKLSAHLAGPFYVRLVWNMATISTDLLALCWCGSIFCWVPNFCWRHQKVWNYPKNVFFALGNLCAATTFRGLVTTRRHRCLAESVLLMRRCSSLTLVGHHSSDAVIIKIPYGTDFSLHRPASHLIFYYGLVKIESESLDQMELT